MLKKIKRISSKLIIVFVLVSLISSISGIINSINMKNIDTEYSAALVDYGFAQGDIGRLGMALNENRAYIRDIVFLTETSQLNDAKSKIEANVKQINTLLDEIRKTNTSQGAKDLFAKIEKGLDDYAPIRQKVMDLGMSNNQEAAYTAWINEGSPMINQIVSDATELLDMNLEAGNRTSNELTQSSNVSLLLSYAIIVLGIIISLVIATIMAKSISRPVIAVQKAAQKLTEGNLDIHISSDEADEVGQMTNSFSMAADRMRESIADISHGLAEISKGNFDIRPEATHYGEFKKIEGSMSQIIFSLSDTLRQISQSADQVSNGSDQVAGGAQELSQGATEQASSIEQLSASISEISGQVTQNAENAQQAREQSEQSGAEVELGNRRMDEMMDAMQQINKKSEEISKIIKTIEDIASQTNILSLNAAVEAARAGAAGKGFSVVAEEIRNLAGKSAEAAKNTTALIGETVTAVNTGAKIAGETSKAMQNVVIGTRNVTAKILEIAEASNNQANSVAQITVGVDQISSVVQNNSATAEQSAAASEELSGQAQVLKDLIGQFKLSTVSGVGIAGSAAVSTPSMESYAYGGPEGKY